MGLSTEDGESKVLIFRAALEYCLKKTVRARKAMEEGVKGNVAEQSCGKGLLLTGGCYHSYPIVQHQCCPNPSHSLIHIASLVIAVLPVDEETESQRVKGLPGNI